MNPLPTTVFGVFEVRPKDFPNPNVKGFEVYHKGVLIGGGYVEPKGFQLYRKMKWHPTAEAMVERLLEDLEKDARKTLKEVLRLKSILALYDQ